MTRNASKSHPAARYTAEIVPTMPNPHAAPAPAAVEAGTGQKWGNWLPVQTPGDLLKRAEAAEAERDRLRAEVAALRTENGLLWQAIPSPDGLATACACMASNNPVRRDLELRAARIRALATPPKPADAETGGWTREAPTEHGLYWAMRRYDRKPVQARFTYRGGTDGRWIMIAVAGVGSYAQSEFVLIGPPVTPPPGWREALAAMDQDQDQEADHAAR